MGRPHQLEAATGAAWNFACPDWKERLKTGRSLVPPLPLDQEKASRAVAIYNKLRLPDVPGQPTLAEAGADWFRDIVAAVCGSIDEEGRRQVAECLTLVPKKNSKTTNAAALTLTLAILNKRPYADLLLLGPTQTIADTGYEQAVGMVRADPEGYLQARFKIRDHIKTIECLTTGAKISIKTFDPDIVTGKKPVLALVDELHLLGFKHYAARVLAQLRGGMISSPESLLMMISTQSDRPPAGVFKAELAQARAIRDGRHSGRARMLPVLYEFPEEIQTAKERPWLDPVNWPMVLPNLDRSITLQRLVDEFEDVKAKGEDEVRLWASQHLNIEIGLALHSQRWRGADYWEAAARPEGLTLDQLIEECAVAVLAVDAGGLDDLFAATVVGRSKTTRKWIYWTHAWCVPEVLDTRKDIAEALKDFEACGDLTIDDSTETAIAGVVAIAEKLKAARLLPKEAGIGLDPHGIGALLDALTEAGFEEPLVAGVAPQGYKLSSAIFSMERKLKDGSIEHGGQPLLTFAVGNAAAEQRGNSVHVTKQVAGKAKIDPLIAAFIGTKLMEANPAAELAPTPRLFMV